MSFRLKVIALLVAPLFLTSCSIDLADLPGFTPFRDVIKRSNFVEDCFDLEKRIGLQTKSRSGGGLLDTYKAGTEGFSVPIDQIDKLVLALKLERVTDPNDSDVKNTAAFCSQFAKSFSQSKPGVLVYKVKGRPQQLRLSSSRSFEFIILFYNQQTQEALMELGYEPIEQVERNAVAPLDILKKAEAGDADAQYKLGLFYSNRNNNFEAYNPKTAALWYEKAAKQEHRDAQYQLSYLQVQLGGTDNSESQKWLKLAAKQGQPDAQYSLAISLLQRREDEHAKKEAKQILLKLTEEGNIDAMRCFAQYNLDPGREAYWYQRAADVGDAYSAGCLADIYANGSLNVQKDLSKAEKYYLIAVSKDLLGVEKIKLGNLYIAGKNYSAACKWYKAAADSVPPLPSLPFIDNNNKDSYDKAMELEKSGHYKEAADFFHQSANFRMRKRSEYSQF